MSRKKLNFIINPKIQELFDNFTELLGIVIGFYSFEDYEKLQYTEKIRSFNAPNCTYCQYIQNELGQLRKCIQCDKEHIAKLKGKKEIISYECHAGMNECILPITFGDELIGFTMIGQFRTTDKIPGHIAKAWEKKFGNSKKLKEAFQQATLVQPHKLKALINIFSFLIEHIVSKKLIETDRSNIVIWLTQYIEEHPKDHLSLDEASELVCCSKSTISHLFKKITGKSFKQYQIELKLERAQKDLRTKPDITVNKVAFSLGYTDPLYFSRLYKKHKHIAPSEEKTFSEK